MAGFSLLFSCQKVQCVFLTVCFGRMDVDVTQSRSMGAPILTVEVKLCNGGAIAQYFVAEISVVFVLEEYVRPHSTLHVATACMSSH